MTATPTVDVKVIFDASSRRRGRFVRILPRTRAVGARPWRILAVFHLLAAGGLYYGIWWRVDPFVYMTLMLKFPVDVDVGAAAGMFGLPDGSEPDTAPKTGRPSVARAAQVAIGTAAYGWLTLATVSACVLALAAGAAFGRFRSSSWRTGGLLTTVLILAVLAAAGYGVYQSYGRRFLPHQLRIGYGGVVVLSAAMGCALGGWARSLTRYASVGLILAGVGTAVAIVLGARYDAIEPEYATAKFVTLAFVIHSGYGWFLLWIPRRLP